VKTGLWREGEDDFVSRAYRSKQISLVARTMVVVMVEDVVVMTTVGEDSC